jgi:hypothetical protein
MFTSIYLTSKYPTMRIQILVRWSLFDDDCVVTELIGWFLCWFPSYEGPPDQTCIFWKNFFLWETAGFKCNLVSDTMHLYFHEIPSGFTRCFYVIQRKWHVGFFTDFCWMEHQQARQVIVKSNGTVINRGLLLLTVKE